eukprot:4388311-Amphidinium_carterae.2
MKPPDPLQYVSLLAVKVLCLSPGDISGALVQPSACQTSGASELAYLDRPVRGERSSMGLRHLSASSKVSG